MTKQEEMAYTAGEICEMYRTAKNKNKIIGILADMNLTDKRQIIKVLKENGYMIKQKAKSKNAETMTKTERDEQAAKVFAEKLSSLKKKDDEGPEITVHFPNYTPPKPVWDLVENRITELNELAEACKAILDNCVEECAKLREFQVAYGIMGGEYHNETDDSNRRGGDDGRQEDT